MVGGDGGQQTGLSREVILFDPKTARKKDNNANIGNGTIGTGLHIGGTPSVTPQPMSDRHLAGVSWSCRWLSVVSVGN